MELSISPYNETEIFNIKGLLKGQKLNEKAGN